MADFVLEGARWGQGGQGTPGGTVYWSFAQTGGFFFGFDRPFAEAAYQALVRDAFAAWEAVADIDFVEVPDAPLNDPEAQAQLRLGWDAIDGPGHIIGTAQYSTDSSGDALAPVTQAEIRFDTAEDWTLDKSAPADGTNFYTVALHEIGHTLGLGHPDAPDTLMYLRQQPQINDLQPGDIEGAQLIYGANTRSTVGDDTITLGAGSEGIDGLAGWDVVVSDMARSGASLHFANGQVLLVDRGGAGGTDALSNMEAVQFTDQSLTLSDFDDAARLSEADFTALAEMYVAYFNRAADALGLLFWADKVAEGMSLTEIAQLFFDQDETRALYADTSDTDAFVASVYSNVLGRAPDPEGQAFWTDQLASGRVTEGTFVLEMINGAQAGDQAYLGAKTDLGLYFGAIKGMSDSADAAHVMAVFGDQATSNISGAKAAVDDHFAQATAPGGGDFLITVVGVLQDPFAGAA